MIKRYSIKDLVSIFNDYVHQLDDIHVETDEQFEAKCDSAKQQFVKEVLHFRDKNPELMLCNYEKDMSVANAEAIVEQMQKNAKKRCAYPFVPNIPIFLTDNIQNNVIYTPSLVKNISEISRASILDKKAVNDLLLTILLMMPVSKVHFTIVDLDKTYALDYIYQNLSPKLYNNPVTDIYALNNVLKPLGDRVLSCIKKYGDVVDYSIKNKLIELPYEVVVFLGETDKYPTEELKNSIESLKKNGSKGGVYVLNIDTCLEDYSEICLPPSLNYMKYKYPDMPDLLKIQRSCSYFYSNSNESLIYPVHIQDIPNLEKAILNYINAEAEKEEPTVSMDISLNSASGEQYDELIDSINIVVGQNGNKEKLFCMDLVSHVHAFVLGQSGSGKSVFLHNVINGVMLKYAPEDLELYLLDFKLGGVEFNRYKNEKHVHALLVDNSDQLITLEILRELRERMTERGRLLRKAGVATIAEYNNLNQNAKLPHILFVADECHELFRVGSDVSRLTSNEISEILTKIAKEGRNQGIHLLLATQTLSGTEISNEILNNISDMYLLKCSVADSERMVMNSSEITSGLKTGQICYHHEDKSEIFKAFYTGKEESEQLMLSINEKSRKHKDNNVFYFSGASLFELNGKVMQNNAKLCKRNSVVVLGRSIDLNQKEVCISLREDYSENILILGLNNQEQCTRVMMNALLSALMANKIRGNDVNFIVFDCLNKDDSIYSDQLDLLAEQNKIQLVKPKKRIEIIKRLVDDIKENRADETMLFVFGQDKFRELKLDVDLMPDDNSIPELSSMFGGAASSTNTFKGAFEYILDKGSEQGVHTILQVEKPSNVLFWDYVSPKLLFQKFKHLVLLKSDERAGGQIGLRDDIRLESLSVDEDRMRAYYYSEESDEYTLFTPFMPQTQDSINEIL